jgi:hypothetical protein
MRGQWERRRLAWLFKRMMCGIGILELGGAADFFQASLHIFLIPGRLRALVRHAPACCHL